jgi:hypothetical protein
VIPNIREISARPIDTEHVSVRVSNIAPSLSHERHLLPLSEGGTGVGQALAILYVLFTSDEGRVIAIDEPNSFLHPGSARRLVQVFNRYPMHQFIIATHAPDIISAAAPKAVFLVRWEEDHSEVDRLGLSDIRATRQILDELGAKLSDVFGADYIVWVEGPTEAVCFPMLVETLRPGQERTISFVAVTSPGDFEGREKQLALDVHQRLASGNALVPPTLAFIFDRETRTSKQREDLLRTLGGIVHFLPRRTYENFLLHVGAIAALVSDLREKAPEPVSRVTAEEIQDWLDTNGVEPDLFPRTSKIPEVSTPAWLCDVDAPKLLKRLLEAKTTTAETYRKTTHSKWLTEWLLQNDSGFLTNLLGFLKIAIMQYAPTAQV